MQPPGVKLPLQCKRLVRSELKDASDMADVFPSDLIRQSIFVVRRRIHRIERRGQTIASHLVAGGEVAVSCQRRLESHLGEGIAPAPVSGPRLNTVGRARTAL